MQHHSAFIATIQATIAHRPLTFRDSRHRDYTVYDIRATERGAVLTLIDNDHGTVSDFTMVPVELLRMSLACKYAPAIYHHVPD